MTAQWETEERARLDAPRRTAAALEAMATNTSGQVEALLDRLGVLGTDILTELRHLRADLRERTASVSSVELAENAKGGVQLTVKCYAGSQVDVAADEAVDEFGRLKRRIEAAQMAQWADTVERVREGVGDP